MHVGVLCSGGKDSHLAAVLAHDAGHTIACFISIVSENPDSFMFHTPSITQVAAQAAACGVAHVVVTTKGEKEAELSDLRHALACAKAAHAIEGIVTGAVASVYQASRVQRLCHELALSCFNPLWQRDSVSILHLLIERGIVALVTGVAAYPLDETFLGREIDSSFISEITTLSSRFGISPTGEGGEFETFVLSSPLFTQPLRVRSFHDSGAQNSWRREVVVA